MNKIAIVTGASRGIGREIAKEIARKGIIVVANYNKSKKEAVELKEELKKENIFIDIYQADVSTVEGIKKLVEYTKSKYQRIDILINNAGISITKLITDTTDKDWNEIINTNLYSAFAMSREIVPIMTNQKQGCIINISSIWGNVGASMECVYSISKAGIDALTKSLSKELGPSNIRVNSIAPGIIETDMNKNLSIKEVEEIRQDIPLQKIGISKDIAKCINWLIEDEYVTGQIIGINGGWN